MAITSIKKGVIPQDIKLGTGLVNCNVLKKQKMSLPGYLIILYLVFHRKFVIHMEQLRFMYLESISGVANIEGISFWGDYPDDWKKEQENVKPHIKSIPSPRNSKFMQTMSAMRDNIHCSDTLLNEIYSAHFAADSFCVGHESNVNFKMKTKFENEEDLRNAVQSIY